MCVEDDIHVEFTNHAWVNFLKYKADDARLEKCKTSIISWLRDLKAVEQKLGINLRHLASHGGEENDGGASELIMQPDQLEFLSNEWKCPDNLTLVNETELLSCRAERTEKSSNWTWSNKNKISTRVTVFENSNRQTNNNMKNPAASQPVKIMHWSITPPRNISQVHITEADRTIKLTMRVFVNQSDVCSRRLRHKCPTITIDVHFANDHAADDAATTATTTDTAADRSSNSRSSSSSISSGGGSRGGEGEGERNVRKPNYCQRSEKPIPSLLLGEVLLNNRAVFNGTCSVRVLNISEYLNEENEQFEISLYLKAMMNHRTYNNFQEGEFVLYRHVKLPFKVHVIYQRCSKFVAATCNCGVAVQSGDDILVIEKWALIYLPHGTYVKTMLNGPMLNVWVVPSPRDLYNTEGLCGQYDWSTGRNFRLKNGTIITYEHLHNGDDDDDGGDHGDNINNNDYDNGDDDEEEEDKDGGGFRIEPDEFIESWRVNMKSSESIFYGTNPTTKNYQPPKFCACMQQQQHQQQKQFDYENKCSQTIDVDHCDKWEWTKNWTRKAATKFCQNFMRGNYSVGKLCGHILSVDFKREIETCVEDIKITGSTDWATSARDAMKEQCLEEVQKDVFLSREIVRKIKSQVCINDCSYHGICVRGMCVCDNGFSTADCSVVYPSRPQILESKNLGQCDVRTMNCSRMILYGRNFINNPNLTCHLQEYKMTNDNPMLVGRRDKRKAIFISTYAAECPLPEVKSYLISVSNDGEHDSDPLLFMPYDSVCNRCDIHKLSCRKKHNSCIIDGMCYKVGEDRQQTINRSKSSTCSDHSKRSSSSIDDYDDHDIGYPSEDSFNFYDEFSDRLVHPNSNALLHRNQLLSSSTTNTNNTVTTNVTSSTKHASSNTTVKSDNFTNNDDDCSNSISRHKAKLQSPEESFINFGIKRILPSQDFINPGQSTSNDFDSSNYF
ncbi:hypothetical protein HELRODRAFT_179612 [Helobdella robusta]|uniref:Vwde helical domain-containing protein n=1 Tax=Helobdella robusta TaxID=6412 RepID=T1FEX8_HELRO|nr:hypothetical protein HELRODRAFT_179612 [Helobdella robusta]ESN95271.1 hypothetical protein HELRODRAFT_179612 [Helobdella robusta]